MQNSLVLFVSFARMFAMKDAVYILSPDGPLFLNPVKVPQGFYGAMTEIPAEQPYDKVEAED